MIKQFRFILILVGLLLTSNIIQASVLSLQETNQQKPPVQKEIQINTPIETGKELFQKYCLTCHQADGGGVPFTFPSLIKSEWVNEDKTRLIKIVLNGLEGDITVGEDTFGGVMPRLNNLTDIQISTVLTWLRKNFENNAGAINPNDIKALRDNKTTTGKTEKK
jgi:mono/diheme cytochrome c family protein